MAEQWVRWMNVDSDDAKTSRWNTAVGGDAPRQAWYYGPRIGKTALTPEFLETLRRVFWAGVDAKLDDALVINGIPLLRVTLPRKFVPHFNADDTTFYLYKAVSSLTIVDFGQLWGEPRAVERRRASPMTMVGNVGLVMDPADMPAPQGVLRAEQSRAERITPPEFPQDPVTTEVEPLAPPKITERARPAVPSPRDVDLPEGIVSAPVWVSDASPGTVATVIPAAPSVPDAPRVRSDGSPEPTVPSGGYGTIAVTSIVVALLLCWAVAAILSFR